MSGYTSAGVDRPIDFSYDTCGFECPKCSGRVMMSFEDCGGHDLVLSVAAARGGLVEFDGHVTDPHLHPVLQTLPWCHSESVDLVEIP